MDVSTHRMSKPKPRMKLEGLSLLVSATREIGQFFGALLCLLLLPCRVLETWTAAQLNRHYPDRFDRVVFYKSGRAALSAFFRAALSDGKHEIVLLPDYICNVVYLAAEHAGASIIPYTTDELFSPNLAHIEELLRTMPVSMVLFASIFGAQNNKAAMLQRVRAIKPDVWIIFDESQNIITHSPIQLDIRSVVVVSFNDKTVPGVMGGALCLPPDSVLCLQPPIRDRFQKLLHEIRILGMLVKRVARKLSQYLGLARTQQLKLPKYEFSQAVWEPYNIEADPITKLSLLYAYFGLLRLAEIETQRRHNTVQLRLFLRSTENLVFLDTEYADIAAYMPVRAIKPDFFEFIGLKGPYATPSSQEISFRPDVFCILNSQDVQLKCLEV